MKSLDILNKLYDHCHKCGTLHPMLDMGLDYETDRFTCDPCSGIVFPASTPAQQ